MQTEEKLFAVIVGSDSKFDCVISCIDEIDLQQQIDFICNDYEHKGMSFSIAGIFKGSTVDFKESKMVRLLK